jgi:hypothetical protein
MDKAASGFGILKWALPSFWCKRRGLRIGALGVPQILRKAPKNVFTVLVDMLLPWRREASRAGGLLKELC